jgi:membrane protease YdiL (CAAX protease family)
MEPETAAANGVPHPLTFIFFNQRGLRPGWRLLIFVGMVYGIFALIRWGLSHVNQSNQTAPSGIAVPISFALGELIPFLLLLFLTWVMSKIEKKKLGEYGLPLRTSALARFFLGYVLWGFIPLSLLLLTLRGLKAFYFGGLALHGAEMFYWAVIWATVFLLVGLFEEFAFRGYMLHTLMEGVGFWPAAIIMAIPFALVHMGNAGETRLGIVAVAFFGIFAAATLRATGNLWLAVGAHAGWDWAQSYFYGVNDSGTVLPGHLLNPHSAGPAWLSGGSVGPEGSVVTLIFWGLMTGGILMIFEKRKAVSMVSATPTEEPAERIRLDF